MNLWKNKYASAFVLMGTLILSLTGCASQPAPNGVERMLYTTATNWVSQTNLVTQTNVQTQIITVTNTVGQVMTTTVTNTVTQVVPQIVQVPQYTFATAAGTSNAVQAVGSAVNVFAPGIGNIASAVALAVLGWFAAFRSNQAKTKAQQVAGNSVQGIETAREIIGALPNGPAILSQYDNWLMQHQQDANLANEAAAMVKQLTSGSQWADAATAILKEVETPSVKAN